MLYSIVSTIIFWWLGNVSGEERRPVFPPAVPVLLFPHLVPSLACCRRKAGVGRGADLGVPSDGRGRGLTAAASVRRAGPDAPGARESLREASCAVL